METSRKKKDFHLEMFGDRLTSEMMRHELTQKDLAEAAGCSQAAISKYLNGRIPKAKELLKLADLLGVSMEWLLAGSTPPSGEPFIQDNWRQRAREAEKKLQKLRSDLETLLRKADL